MNMQKHSKHTEEQWAGSQLGTPGEQVAFFLWKQQSLFFGTM